MEYVVNKESVERGCDLGYLAMQTAVNDDAPTAAVCAFAKTCAKVVNENPPDVAADFCLGAILTFAHFFNEVAEEEEKQGEEQNADMLKELFGDLLKDLDKLGE